MPKFIVSTDSTADLYADYVRAHDVRLAPLSFTMEKDGVVREYLDAFTDYAQYLDFYAQLRDKVSARTSMLNYDAHYTHFEKIAREGGTDVLHHHLERPRVHHPCGAPRGGGCQKEISFLQPESGGLARGHDRPGRAGL